MTTTTTAKASTTRSHTELRSGIHPGRGLGTAALACIASAWIAVLALIGRHRVFVSSDSVSNYVHVWWIATGLQHGHGLTLHMPVLGHGRALTYPYAFLPWTAAGFLWTQIGERAVTLTLVAGCVVLVASMFWALPELLEDRWLAAAALASPVLVAVAIIGQLPFAWAAAGLFVAVGLWRRQHVAAAVLAAAAAQATHAAVVLPIAAVLVAGMLVRRWDRRMALAYLTSLVLALPAVWLVIASPVFSDTTLSTKVVEFVGTVVVRSFVVTVPLALVWIGRRASGWFGPAALVTLLSLNVAVLRPLDTRYAWRGLRRQPDRSMLAFVGSQEFTPGDTYRILRAADGKVGMYQLVEHGGRLDSELFPESIDRRSFPDTATYARFLQARHVDVVLDYASFDTYYRTNEHGLLAALAASDACSPQGVHVVRFHHDRAFDGYRIDRSCR